CFCLGECYTRLETRDYRQPSVCTFFASFFGQPLSRKHRLPIILGLITDGILKTWRHNTDDSSFASDVYLAADDVGITAKTALPKTVAENDNVRPTGFIFVASEDASELWLDAEKREVICRDGGAEHAFRVATFSKDRSGALKHRNVFKRRRRLLHVEEVRH